MRNSLQLLMLSVLAGILLSGCGGGGSTPPPNGNGNGNPLPSVTSISPSSATVGEASFTLTVTGSNFVSGSVVNWAGTALTTTFVSSTSLTASIPASNLSTAGTAQVIVTNPAPGGGTSTAKIFNINNPAPVVASLSQTSADVGSSDFTLTVTGSSFVSTSVVRWNGSDRTTSFGSGTQLAATITASDLAIAGNAQVSVANPTPGGGNSSGLTFAIHPQVANGNALPGDPASLAVNVTSDVLPVSVDASDVQGDIIMSRLDVRFDTSATVAQVNAALANIGGGIVSMSQGLPAVTIGIPRQNSLASLQAVAAHLEASPGILFVGLGVLQKRQAIFNGTDAASIAVVRHLIAARFPAAWNVPRSDVFGDPGHPASQVCPIPPIPVLVDDFFSVTPPAPFTAAFPSFTPAAAPQPGFSAGDLLHGYVTTEVLGANPLGANPFAFSSCLDLHLVQLGAYLTMFQTIDDLVAHMPTGEKFVVNYSAGFVGNCGALTPAPCQPPTDVLTAAFPRAQAALHWKEKTHDLWPKFLFVASGGNDFDEESTTIYPGLGESHFESFATISQLTDTQFNFVFNDNFWTPSPQNQTHGFTSLKATPGEVASLLQSVQNAGVAGAAVADNVIVVGSRKSPDPTQILTQHVLPSQLAESDFSNNGPDISAVGEDILNSGVDGTSFSAPQVSGLVSFLWMLSPDLQSQPVAVTKRAIVANANNGFLDAYATVLSLDAAAAPTPQNAPVRMALLDTNSDTKFDENDLTIFLSHFQDGAGNPVEPTAPDYSRWDLNGDGFTGGSGTEQFDLDRVFSTQYGATNYSLDITEDIEQQTVHFNETDLTDLQVLCYYAYSAMYTGDPAVRFQLVGGCAGVTVTVNPANTTVQIGGTKQFSATVHGSSDPRVTWRVSGSGNSIDANGLLTAGNTAGTFTVRATSVADVNAFGEATVTIASAQSCPSAVLQNINKGIAVTVTDRVGGDSKSTSTDLTISNSFNSNDSNETGTASYFSADLTIADNNTGRDIPGGSGIDAQVEDAFVIVPSDPALLGQPMQLTGNVVVDASAQVSGDRATAGWVLSFGLGAGINSSNARISTLSGLDSGTIRGGTFAVTNNSAVFGQPVLPQTLFKVFTNYACDPSRETCPPRSAAGTGTGHVHGTLHWGGLTVKDQSGNSVSFTQCSVSGATY